MLIGLVVGNVDLLDLGVFVVGVGVVDLVGIWLLGVVLVFLFGLMFVVVGLLLGFDGLVVVLLDVLFE